MEPRKNDVVHGWWGVGEVTDVALGQGNCRVRGDLKTHWVMNSDITLNENQEERDRIVDESLTLRNI